MVGGGWGPPQFPAAAGEGGGWGPPQFPAAAEDGGRRGLPLLPRERQNLPQKASSDRIINSPVSASASARRRADLGSTLAANQRAEAILPS
jgi:hypothetical protein